MLKMEMIYYHKPVSKSYTKPVDHFLFLLAVLCLHVQHLFFFEATCGGLDWTGKAGHDGGRSWLF